jgi:hypothetical protein
MKDEKERLPLSKILKNSVSVSKRTYKLSPQNLKIEY